MEVRMKQKTKQVRTVKISSRRNGKTQAANEAAKAVEREGGKVVKAQPPKKKTRKPQQRMKVSNFDLVDGGACPHCMTNRQSITLEDALNNAYTLDVEVQGKGDGVTRTCKNCGHKWYLNRIIHTCKCLSCPKGEKRS
jgi:transcription elongation factor Elf1